MGRGTGSVEVERGKIEDQQKMEEAEPIQVITPYECEYTVMLSPPSAPVVKESTGITMFIIDEMREAKEAKARLAKDELIKKMAMEQKLRRESARRSRGESGPDKMPLTSTTHNFCDIHCNISTTNTIAN